MRVLIVAAVAGLTLAGCNQDGGAENATAANAVDELANADIVVNDPTAIDAATAQDANIAAETRFELNAEMNADGNTAADANESGNNAD